jgi:hypothetical protein
MFTKKQAAGEVIADRARYLKGILRNLQSGKDKGAEPELDHDGDPELELRTHTKSEIDLRQEFEGYQLGKAQERLAGFNDVELQEVRDLFTSAHQDNYTIKTWLNRGWKRTPDALNSQLVKWLMTKDELWIERLLVNPEDKSFEAWNAQRVSKLLGKPA